MVNAALSARWHCVLANDIDPMKCTVYRQNWGADHLIEGDIAQLTAQQMPGPLDLIWASSPCQDFSLAGSGQGLKGARSGVFTHWHGLLDQTVQSGRAPRIIAFENVTGLMSRAGGRDTRNGREKGGGEHGVVCPHGWAPHLVANGEST